MREGFVFFRSYLSVLLLVEEKHRAELLEAICAYALDGVLLPLSGKSEVAMSAIKPLIDMNERHLARTKKRASEEGESVQNRRKTLPPLVTPQEKEIEIEKEIKKEKEKEQAAPRPRRAFELARSRGLLVGEEVGGSAYPLAVPVRENDALPLRGGKGFLAYDSMCVKPLSPAKGRGTAPLTGAPRGRSNEVRGGGKRVIPRAAPLLPSVSPHTKSLVVVSASS